MYRAVKERTEKDGGETLNVWARRREWHLHTHLSVCLLSLPLSCSFIVPLLVLVFGFWTVKSKPGQAVSSGMKDGEGREEGKLGKTWGWECWGCWWDFIGRGMDSFANTLCHPSKSQWRQQDFKVQSRLVQKWMSLEVIKTGRNLYDITILLFH